MKDEGSIRRLFLLLYLRVTPKSLVRRSSWKGREREKKATYRFYFSVLTKKTIGIKTFNVKVE